MSSSSFHNNFDLQSNHICSIIVCSDKERTIYVVNTYHKSITESKTLGHKKVNKNYCT